MLFQVRKNNLAGSRIVKTPAPELGEGDILLKVDRFALTANNITYGVAGDKIGYWRFFPVDEEWGVIPVWGFADVVATNNEKIPVGERLYGYFPMGSHLKLSPVKISEHRLIDATPHRAELAPVYNTYMRLAGEPGYDRTLDDERMVLFPLYATSFCLYDFLLDNDWFGADQVVIVSASSKTAIGLAYALASDDKAPPAIALTSARNRRFVESLGLYASTTTYDGLDEINSAKATVIVDMSGNGDVLGRLHSHLNNQMKYCSNVGVTHWENNKMGDGFIAERSAMFFAPGHIQKRTKDWGPGIFEQKAYMFWKQTALKSRDWLKIRHIEDEDGLAAIYQDLRQGKLSPDQGVAVVL